MFTVKLFITPIMTNVNTFLTTNIKKYIFDAKKPGCVIHLGFLKNSFLFRLAVVKLRVSFLQLFIEVFGLVAVQTVAD